jgi:micrococcal nuclease
VPVHRYSFLLALTILLFVPVSVLDAEEEGSSGLILLRGKPTPVVWQDGDTLTFMKGPLKGKTGRLVGYNTLESYGPVHRWGEWSGQELLGLAVEARKVAAAQEWSCTKQKGRDSYGRLLINCPDARAALLDSGLAHVFAYEGEPDPNDLARQTAARMDSRGIWLKGRPETIISNVSADNSGRVFLRVVNSRSGKTEVRHQRGDYSICDEICDGPSVSGSCMLFIPYEQRYSDSISCLQ